MGLVNSLEIYEQAQGRYIVGGYDTYLLEMIKAQIGAAEETRTPFILLVSPKRLREIGIDYFTAVAKLAVSKTTVPVALHLDHGSSLEEIVEVIKHGFTSVMIDASRLPFKENVSLTRKVVEFAHKRKVTVEAQVGKMPGKEGNLQKSKEEMTDPELVCRFVKETGIDVLAVTIGTVHGGRSLTLDFERLAKIHQVVPIPLTLHGGTGIPREAMGKLLSLGVRKINIGTLINVAFSRGVKEGINKKGPADSAAIFALAEKRVKEAIKQTFENFGCLGKAGRNAHV